MKSGDISDERDWSLYEDDFENILDFVFEQKTFKTHACLRDREVVDGLIRSTEFTGQSYDETKRELVPDGWTHDHCWFCMTRIEHGMTYWGNADDVMVLCNHCYEHYADRIRFKQQ
ncbi:MAG: hypothetical protein HY300_20925, partial [Verrucomicrobia bacterium]|nr:hypothetical protein [Verrucomicrobiota bacterium]